MLSPPIQNTRHTSTLFWKEGAGNSWWKAHQDHPIRAKVAFPSWRLISITYHKGYRSWDNVRALLLARSCTPQTWQESDSVQSYRDILKMSVEVRFKKRNIFREQPC